MLESPHSDSLVATLPVHDSFDYLTGGADHGLILLADHAGAVVPGQYGQLGLREDQFRRHIAYDIGVREVVSQLSAHLDVPAFLGKYSRLLIDLNRGEDDPTLIMKLSDGAVVPENLKVNAAERERRLQGFYRPYHDGISSIIDQTLKFGKIPLLLSVHSFTPAWKGIGRPWHASILWDSDDRLVMPLLSRLQQEDGLTIGDNVPYSGELSGDTLNQHGTKRGIAHALIEIRQDLISNPEGQKEWGERLARIVSEILVDENFMKSLKQVRQKI